VAVHYKRGRILKSGQDGVGMKLQAEEGKIGWLYRLSESQEYSRVGDFPDSLHLFGDGL
jgi:hypothetical protein